MLALLDTATGEVAPLEPRVPGQLSVYLCGPTVAGVPHLGHARVNLVWDGLRRYLTWTGLHVHFVSNVTDIEDKIIAKAEEEGTCTEDVAARYEALWRETMARLGIEAPDDVPHATAYVEQMVALVGELVRRGAAYEAGDGVYFSTDAVPGYGLLARQDPATLRSGARVDAGEAGKRSPLDFVLWKYAKTGEPAWTSPWGLGRPGWHTECVVMSLDLLGEGFDLHLGGLDLSFPHHENERAQAVAAGYTFARRWAHNGMLVDEQGEKMSRSVGNGMSLPELLDRYDARVLRYLVLQTHYRSPMSVSEESLESARGAVRRLDNFAWETRDLPPAAADAEVVERFKGRLDDDFDTPGALAVLMGAVRAARGSTEHAPALAAAVRECCERALGLALRARAADLDREVAALVAERDGARASRDWGRADSIRSQLAAMGYAVEDGPAGTVVRHEGA
jgi:cysteinyl-tRNA synthetase